jgi:hypothetical protein
LKGDASSAKNRFPAKNFRILDDYAFRNCCHSDLPLSCLIISSIRMKCLEKFRSRGRMQCEAIAQALPSMCTGHSMLCPYKDETGRRKASSRSDRSRHMASRRTGRVKCNRIGGTNREIDASANAGPRPSQTQTDRIVCATKIGSAVATGANYQPRM